MSTAPAVPATPASRYARIDALRGVAMLWMAAFHLSFDLNHFRLIPRQNFYTDPFWTWQRVVIVSIFLFCAGLGQAVAEARRGSRLDARFWRRWAQIAACAVLVSAGSWLMFPRSWISFGVLHGIALMLIALHLLAPLRRGLWVAGVVAIVLPLWVQHPFFDTRLTNWVGLVTRKPVTEDFVPLLPWLGVMCFGLAAGRWALRHRPHWLAAGAPGGGMGRVMGRMTGRTVQGLAGLGRWSLAFYMLHQPVLIGLVLGWKALAGR